MPTIHKPNKIVTKLSKKTVYTLQIALPKLLSTALAYKGVERHWGNTSAFLPIYLPSSRGAMTYAPL